MALKAKSIVANPMTVLSFFVPLLMIYSLNFVLSTLIGKALFNRGNAIALVYGTVMRNLSMALAVAITVLGSEKGAEIALIIAMGYIIQVQSAAWYVKLTDKIFGTPVIDVPCLAPESYELKSLEFEVVTVNDQGEEIKREQKEAEYYTEDLGNGVTLDLVYIPGDKFMMGSPEGEGQKSEKPLHEVTVQPFFLGKFQVTQAQWRAISSLPKVNRDLESDPSRFKGNERPVEQVTWNDAVEFCQRLSLQTGREYRLPSEAEWEYACRARTTTPFNLGETITGELANYDGSRTYASEPQRYYRQKTTPVGSFPPNAFGLYDMHGQVWEWCKDNWYENYQGAPTDGSAWLSGTSSMKVIRGGAWNNGPYICRSAYRDFNSRDSRGIDIGLRVVCVASRVT